MTTDKKNRLSERLKSLRDQVAGMMKAAEEEEASVADTALSEEPVSEEAQPEVKEAKTVRRASDGEIAAALRRFTWDSDKAIKETAEKQTAEESQKEEREDAPTAGRTGELADELLDEFLTELHKELADEVPEEKSEEALKETGEDTLEETAEEALEEFLEEAPEETREVVSEETPEELQEAAPESAREEAGTESPEERSDAFPAELLEGIAAGIRDGITPSAHTQKAEASSAEESGAESETAEEAPEEQSAEKAGGFTGFAELLARLKTESEERFSAWEKSVRAEGGASEETKDAAGEAYEPDPADVAKLWEPHRERREDGSSVDPEREETHVFTEEDLKNIPRDPESDELTEETSAELLDEEEEEVQGYTPRDFRPIRRRRYYRSGLVGGIMYFLFVVCVSVALAAFGWLAADDMLSLNKEYIEAEVYVGEDMDVSQIATELQTKGLIRYRKLFALFGKFFHAEEKIEPGTYTLSTKLDYRALIQNMHHYTGWTGEAMATVKVTIPEGKTVMETFQILADHGVCPYETLMECAATETFDYDFLADIPDGDATRLEGYLFPDTYEFYADSSPKAAICRFLDNFDQRIPERVSEQAAANGFTLREILIVASLIEKEAGNDAERPTIASVIYNRLQSTSYPYLQIDATIQYAMGEHKEHLTSSDLEVDSPYNTYLYPGLPPGPIANPGLASIRAALNPENTGYYFYALNKNGKHNFFSSYNEFQRFINSSDFGG